ncbi:MAG: peptidase M50 [Methanosarcinales archaeon]|nr:peptidase M50 [Methanosarcinales archaeon]
MLITALVVSLSYMIGTTVNRSQTLKKMNITAWGPVIMIRTRLGLGLLDTLASKKRLWRFVASAGVPLVVAGMLYIFLLLLLMNYVMIRFTPEPSSYTAPRNILLIPGVNQFIPLVWGWVALLVTMVVHEMAHGILCRVEGVRVKSMGVALLAFPVAAFVEPDDEELFGTPQKPAVASRSARVRILSAGVISNFIVAFLAMALFFGPVIGAITPLDRVVVADVENDTAADLAGFQKSMIVLGLNGTSTSSLEELYQNFSRTSGYSELHLQNGDRQMDIPLQGKPERGVLVVSILEDSPASAAGMPERFVITGIGGRPVKGLNEFRAVMNDTLPGQNITVETNKGVFPISLDTKEDGKGFIGVILSGDAVNVDGVTFQVFPAGSFLAALKAIPHSGLAGMNSMMGLPFTGIPGFTEDGFQGFSGWIANFFQPSGWAAPLGGKLFWITNFLLWVGWINLYAGLFNCLPAVPLDGGHIFRDLLRSFFDRFVRDAARAEKMTSTVVAILAWLIFSSLLFTVVAPYLAHGILS